MVGAASYTAADHRLNWLYGRFSDNNIAGCCNPARSQKGRANVWKDRNLNTSMAGLTYGITNISNCRSYKINMKINILD